MLPFTYALKSRGISYIESKRTHWLSSYYQRYGSCCFDGFSVLSFSYPKSQPDVKISVKAMTKINIALISIKSLLGQGIFNYAVENNQITDTSDDANQYDHPNCVGASLSKFIRQGLFLFHPSIME